MSKVKPLIEDTNLNGAQAFLDMFGLTITNDENFDVDSHADIKKDGKTVGSIVYSNDKICISANIDLGRLVASFKPDEEHKKSENIDHPSCELLYQLAIDYSIFRGQKETITGTHILDCRRVGLKDFSCYAHHELTYTVDGTKKFSLCFLNHGQTFGVEFIEGDISEVIDIRPFDDENGYVRHDIKKGTYVRRMGYPYRKCSSITSGSREALNVFSMTKQNGEVSNLVNKFCIKDGFQNNSPVSNTEETIIQIGRIMHELDPDMYSKIQELRTMLEMQGTSLLDELINASLRSYSDKVIESLLGYVPQLEEPAKIPSILPVNFYN